MLDLNHLLAVAAERWHGRSGRHDLLLESAPEALPLEGDPQLLDQLFEKLLSNAFKFSPAGGAVEIAARRLGDEALVTVRDYGIGIPPEDLELLFQRFARGRNVSVRSFGGLGLGLWLSREIAEAHGGSITVESEAGTGTTFCVRLPLLPRKESVLHDA